MLILENLKILKSKKKELEFHFPVTMQESPECCSLFGSSSTKCINGSCNKMLP